MDGLKRICMMLGSKTAEIKLMSPGEMPVQGTSPEEVVENHFGDLSPCPFCGSDAVLAGSLNKATDIYVAKVICLGYRRGSPDSRVHCNANLFVSIEGGSRKESQLKANAEARGRWNKRALRETERPNPRAAASA